MQMNHESTYIGGLLPHLLMENATSESMPSMEYDISRTLPGIYNQPYFCCFIGFYNTFQFSLKEKIMVHRLAYSLFMLLPAASFTCD